MRTRQFSSRTHKSGAAGLVAVAVSVALAACGSPDPAGTEVRGDVDYEPVSLAETTHEDPVAATLALGLHLAAEAGEENLVVSPASIAVALALIAEGADGETLEALDSVLGASGADRTHAYNALQAAVLEYNGDPAIVQEEELPERPLLHLANGVTIDEQAEIEQEYLDALVRSFDTGVVTTDFAGDEGKAVLDAWVAEHTGGLIEESAIEPTVDTILVLQNAVLLAARWEHPFSTEGTRERPFTTATGEEEQVETMHQTREADYGETADAQILRLPYTEGFAMDVVLPAEGTAPASLTAADWADLDAALDAGSRTRVALALPQVDTEFAMSLEEPLRALGLASMFGPGGLDGIARLAEISQVEHQAVLTIDEEGTVAAAVTEIAVEATSMQVPETSVDMIVDRPYALRIVHVETGWPLFYAIINDPTA